MEETVNEKKGKPGKANIYSVLHVRKETRRKVLQDLAKLNRKDFGRRLRADEYVALAISKLTPEDMTKLVEGSLSNQDRLERGFKAYIAKNGPVTKDDFIGKIMSGEIRMSGETDIVDNSGSPSA